MYNKYIKNEILKLYINNGENVWITVHGPSMFPVLQENYKIHIKKIEKIKTGKIIVFTLNNLLVVHRIIKINKKNNTVITMGDDVPAIDGYISFNDILGEVDYFTNNEGKTYNINSLKFYNIFSTGMSLFMCVFIVKKEKFKVSKLSWIRRSNFIMQITKKICEWEIEKKTNEN